MIFVGTPDPKLNLWNLLENPGAESEFDFWKQIGDTPVIIDSNGSFHSGIYPTNGRSCFAGGYTTIGTRSQLLQTIDLLGIPTDQIDTGILQIEISFSYQTWHHTNRTDDTVEIDVIFFSNSSNVIGRIHSDKLICRISNPKWCHYKNVFSLPSGTRLISYIMIFSNNDRIDTSIDGYIDDNSVIFL